MTARVIAGFLMLAALVVLVFWRAHRDGQLKYALQGAGITMGLIAFIFAAMWLIVGGAR